MYNKIPSTLFLRSFITIKYMTHEMIITQHGISALNYLYFRKRKNTWGEKTDIGIVFVFKNFRKRNQREEWGRTSKGRYKWNKFQNYGLRRYLRAGFSKGTNLYDNIERPFNSKNRFFLFLQNTNRARSDDIPMLFILIPMIFLFLHDDFGLKNLYI